MYRELSSRVACFPLPPLHEPVLHDAPIPPEGGRVIDDDRCSVTGGCRPRREGGNISPWAQRVLWALRGSRIRPTNDRRQRPRRRRCRRCRLIRKECGPSATLPFRRPAAVRLRMWNVKCTTTRRAAMLPTRSPARRWTE